MAKLKPLEKWREETFEEPGPSMRVVYKWANEGHIPGARKIGGLWFVDPDKSKQTTGNPLVDKVLQAN
ncbi:DNA-binding protein [Marinobacter sp. W-8]|uniref:DNA-binding protein n=1 Tax=Marinobacter sp. W-8 TaxID=3369658 RepID=UPI0037C5A590